MQNLLYLLALIMLQDAETTSYILGSTLMLVAAEVPRIAQMFGLDTSTRGNIGSVVHHVVRIHAGKAIRTLGEEAFRFERRSKLFLLPGLGCIHLLDGCESYTIIAASLVLSCFIFFLTFAWFPLLLPLIYMILTAMGGERAIADYIGYHELFIHRSARIYTWNEPGPF